MVLEQPEPYEDLVEFCKMHGGSLTENVARNVMFQLMEELKHCKRTLQVSVMRPCVLSGNKYCVSFSKKLMHLC